MQLLALVLILMLAGKGGGMEQLKPIIEEFGGEEAASAFKQAEELSEVINAVQSLAQAVPAGGGGEKSVAGGEEEAAAGGDGIGDVGGGFPLSPVSAIADERITYCLSRYIALGD